MISTGFVFLIVIIQFTDSYDPCQTPSGHPGTCIPLSQCPPLNAYFNNGSLSSETTNLLRRSHCGFFRRHPRVCCPTNTTPSPKTTIASSDLLPDPSTCGLHSSGKIVGGEKTEIDEFPWMALLEYQLNDGTKSFECGGSLINKRYVLTAAHCVLPQLTKVRLGEYNTKTDPDCITTPFGRDCAPPAVDFGIEEKIVYMSYNRTDSNQNHDIGLIRLDRDVKYSDFIRPICLPLKAEDIYKSYTGQKLTVSGWGLTEKGVKSSFKLKVQVPVKELSQCVADYRKIDIKVELHEGQICAGGAKGKDSCRADSGGPLMHFKLDENKDPHFYAIGVVSYGPTPCGQENLPAVYTRVSKYVSWIMSNLKP